MPNVSSFGAQTDNAVVSGTVTDRQMIIPEVPPQGLMSVGPRQTYNYVKEPWNAQTSYVFYDAVKDGKGSTYIAMKPVVPAGTPLTDEDFWFKSSDPNAQLNELQEVVKLYDGRISQNASAITEEVARATAAEATKAPTNHASEETIYGVGNAANYGHLRLADDNTPITSGANDGVAATPKMINDLFYKKPIMIVIGDSYSANAQSETPLWHEIVSKRLNMTVANYASDGQGFTAGNNNFASQMNTAINDYKTNNKNVKKIYIMGGLNDLPTSTTPNQIGIACENLCKTAKQNFPYAEITVIGMLPFQNYNWYSNSTSIPDGRALQINDYLAYHTANTTAIYISGLYYGLCIKDFFGTANSSGQKHPSAKGEALLASLALGSPYIWEVSKTFDDMPTLNDVPATNCNVSKQPGGMLKLDLTFENVNTTNKLTLDLKHAPTARGYIIAIDSFGKSAFAYGPSKKIINQNALTNNSTIYISYDIAIF